MKTETLLLSMRAEQREDHAALLKSIGEVKTILTDHTLEDSTRFDAVDKRLAPLESARSVLRWAVGCVFVAGLGLVSSILVLLVKHS